MFPGLAALLRSFAPDTVYDELIMQVPAGKKYVDIRPLLVEALRKPPNYIGEDCAIIFRLRKPDGSCPGLSDNVDIVGGMTIEFEVVQKK